MSGYTKLFSSIVASTIWRTDNYTRIVWITMLAMADRRGVVEGSVPGLADLARVPVSACRKALKALESPDEDSRSKDHEGRRILSIDGGWQLVNHAKYRAKMSADDRREYLRQKKAEQRARQHSVNTRQQMSTMSSHTDPAPDPDPKAEAQDQEHNPPRPNRAAPLPAEPPRFAPTEKPTPSLFNGQSARAHGQHPVCFIARGLCVTRWVWEELVGKRGGPQFETELRLWMQTTVAELDGIPIGDKPDDFWRNKFAERWPTVSASPRYQRPDPNAVTEAEMDRLRAKGLV